jgi:hypothetical protein
MIDVYYPYFQKEAKWEELRYSLRSVERHLKEEFRIWIVGDLPAWIRNINHIAHTRCEGMQENTVFDSITKLLLFCDHPDTGSDFVRMYDDIYLISDVSLDEIRKVKALHEYKDLGFEGGTWHDQLHRTLNILVEKGYPAWNTETHFPEVFNKYKMKWIIEAYNALDRRLLTSSLYFNTFFPEVQPLIFKKDYGIQFYENRDNEFYSSSEGNLEEKCKGKLYLNHNNSGLNENLKKFMMKRFSKKSMFEK